MTQSNGDRFDRVDNEVINLKLATSAMMQTLELHQQNFAVIVAELRCDREQRQQEMAKVNARLNKAEETAAAINAILQMVTRRLAGD